MIGSYPEPHTAILTLGDDLLHSRGAGREAPAWLEGDGFWSVAQDARATGAAIDNALAADSKSIVTVQANVRIGTSAHVERRDSASSILDEAKARFLQIADNRAWLNSRRLRVIGHLFEAEDESQEWPDLHAAIREARKTYQADGTLPDFEDLGVLANGIRAAL